MSKKSRRRNKKILAALALAGGAAMLGKRGKGPVTGVVNPNEATRIATDAGADIAEAVVPSRFQTRFTKDGIGPNELSGYSKRVRGVTHPILGQSTANPNRFGTLYKKGGRVTGIAKRGFGRALMKGKK